ncbi:gibberellin 20-oxidase [Aspergillus nomiae NRRL 13137]|uniref:Gibberellin 20-oxidase n=1 Tax=Aspergillus nomiae NRRL (strain ATCC 15546 / NRRL 13137 / CBS 260.88 / M93) TaxID=1509407 RepID=A0A0L1J4M8_ASPN3|nr:gibberellin 20-oxidase [Aspergillus nomiae NRRL 13137]KNG86630.1 gibberellin 20-oxidase [Aspergillus nomiae NRRL 13137]
MAPGDGSASMEIPIVDFSSWKNTQDQASRLRTAQELVKACQTVGFVYIINHSLSESVLNEAFDWMKRLFNLPEEEKMKRLILRVGQCIGGIHGLDWRKSPRRCPPEMMKKQKESCERSQMSKYVMAYLEVYDIGSDQNADQPNQWIPDEALVGFRAFMIKFYWECWTVGEELLRALAIGLNLEDDSYLVDKHSGHGNQLRLLHYLPVPAEDLEKERTARCPAHTDWSSLTMLFQDDCGGLEVEDISRPGTFVSAPPLENAIVVNVGDLLQMWSNDRLKSTNHRVRMPPLADRYEGPNRMTRERFSIPYFMSPDPSSVIECIPSCMSENQPAKYKPITQAEYNKMRASMMY